MLERDILLNSSLVLLLLTLAMHVHFVSRRLTRQGYLLACLGALIPVLDLTWLLTGDSRLELLARVAFFRSAVPGLLTTLGIMALLAFLLPLPRVLRVASSLLLGLTLYHLAALVTPAGTWLLAPFHTERSSLPFLPEHHLPMLLLLPVAAVTLELFSRARRPLLYLAGSLVLLYGFLGAFQYAVLNLTISDGTEDFVSIEISPEDPWLTRWMVVRETPLAYHFQRMRFTGTSLGPEILLPRWNDPGQFLNLLAHPLVKHYYYNVFTHPVVETKTDQNKITLEIQELQFQSPLVPGPTFTLESNLQEGNLEYTLSRFN